MTIAENLPERAPSRGVHKRVQEDGRKRTSIAEKLSLGIGTCLLCLCGACSLIVPGPDDFTYDLVDSGVDGGGLDGGGMDGGTDAAIPFDAGCPDMCGGECTNFNTDPLHCGSCAVSCTAPTNGSATCVDAACGFACDAGYVAVVGNCEPLPAPRQIAPLSTATSTSRRPTFRWELRPRTDGARIEVCADRACASVLQTIDASGTSGRPTADLPPGIVFWRLFGRQGSNVGVEPSFTWLLHVGARSAPADTSWGTTLDVNGDGFADLAVGASAEDDGADMDVGRAYVYLGRAVGLDTTPATTLLGPGGAGGFFGASVASAGDVNGDGYADLAVGAYREDVGPDVDVGRTYVYLGSAAGLAAAPATTLVGPAVAGGAFGISVASAGDVNGDGYADLAVGATGVSSGTGRAYVYLGRAVGLATTPATTLIGPDGPGGRFGWPVASAGDVDGDGFADLAVGADGVSSNAGSAYVYLGRAVGLDTTPATTLLGPGGAGGYFGVSVANAGDVDGDGFADLAVGASGESSGTGGAHIYLGSAVGLATTPATTLLGPAGARAFGVSMASAGDVDGDGYADLAVGAGGPSSNSGSVYVYLGSAAGLATGPATTLTLLGPAGVGLGISVAGGRDVNGDGFADLAVGAAGVGLSSSAGSAYVYLGSAAGLDTTPAATLLSPAGAVGLFGSSVASAGDVDGDEFADLAIGAGGVRSSSEARNSTCGAALATTPAREPLAALA